MKRSKRFESVAALSRSVGSLQSTTFDLAIVGGGVMGASIARHAAAAGLSVALLEAADYASGVSGKSIPLLHATDGRLSVGKLRWLRKAASERKRLHGMAPHLAVEKTVIVPLRHWTSRLRCRFTHLLCDSVGRAGGKNRLRTGATKPLQDNGPFFDGGRFPCTWSYDDFLIDDARLVLALLRDAACNGAISANYVRVESIEQRRDQYFLSSVDETSGSEFSVRCRCVVNATARETIHHPNDTDLSFSNVGPTSSLFLKRVQVAIPRECLPINHPMLIEAEDQRRVSVVPRGQVTYIRATRAAEESAFEPQPEVTHEDIQYLLQALTSYFAVEPVQLADVVSCSARFFAASEVPWNGKNRRESVRVGPGGVITCDRAHLEGARPILNKVLVQVENKLQRSVTIAEESYVLPGGDLVAPDFSAESNFERSAIGGEVGRVCARYSTDEQTALRLVRLYGSEVGQAIGREPDRLSPLVFAGEIDWAVGVEGARTLEDVLYRRLQIVSYEPFELALLLPAITERMAKLLAWDAVEQTRQRILVEQRIAFDLKAVPLVD